MSSSTESTPPGGYVTFEVTMRKDAADQSLALQGLADTYGWNTRARYTLPADLDRQHTPEAWQVLDGDLAAVSEENFGTDIYGQSATNFIAHLRSYLDGSRAGIQDYIDTPLEAGTVVTPEMQQRANRLWDNEPDQPPFTAALRDEGIFRNDPDQPRHRSWAVIAGTITRERLANYLRFNGFDRHVLHGTIGKMFDVMGIASGVMASPRTPAEVKEEDYISDEDYKQLMKSAGLTRHYRDEIRRAMLEETDSQLQTGRPHKHEVTFEGLLKFGNGHFWTRPEKISVYSLAKLADTFEKDTPAKRFLQQFP